MNFKLKLCIALGLVFSAINVCMAASQAPITTFSCQCPDPLTSNHCECYDNAIPTYTGGSTPIISQVHLNADPQSPGTYDANIQLYCTSSETPYPPGTDHADFTHPNSVACSNTYNSQGPGVEVYSNYYCHTSEANHYVTVNGYDCFTTPHSS